MSRLISATERLFRRLLGENGGASVVEFGLAAPIVVLITVGAIETAVMLFDHNRATEATRAGVRVAVIEGPAADVSNISSGPITCTSSGGSVSCTTGVTDTSAFNNVVTAMQAVMPQIAATNVEIRYEDSGVGLAEAGGIKPFVTISLKNLQYHFLVLDAFIGSGSTIAMPDFSSTSLTVAPGGAASP